MAKKEKKQSFLGGTAILAAAVAAVKLIGAVYKIPLGNIIGDEGKAHFTVAYNIYNLLLTISTAGLPLAISKLTSEAHALGRENEKRKIFRTAIWLFFALGACFSLLMYFGAEQLAAFMVDDLAFWSIRALAPAVFCVCLLACMRGYTQGQGNMKPTAISQVLEALCKLGFGLSLAWYFLQLGYGVEISAAGAILGVTIGTIMSMLFLIFYLVTHRDRQLSSDVPESGGTLMKKVLLIGVPITLSNSAMSIITLIDSKIVLGRLESISSALTETPTALYGQYTFGMDLINLPPLLCLSRDHEPDPLCGGGHGPAGQRRGQPHYLLRLPAHRHSGHPCRRGPQRPLGAHSAHALPRPGGGCRCRGAPPAGAGYCLYLHLPDDPDQRHLAVLRP